MALQQPGLVVKLRPTGPWRIGPDSGDRHFVDVTYHSDSLYAAVTGAMRLLGHLDDWLDATARNPAGSAVRFSSCFPFVDEIGFVMPPRSVWPPADSTKVRWKSARFIPLGLVGPLLAGNVLEEDRWSVDGVSECLTPLGRSGPFRPALRPAAAVDRITGSCEPHSTACLEFSSGAGLWAVIGFADEESRARWSAPVRAALRLLADSGFGGERSRMGTRRGAGIRGRISAGNDFARAAAAGCSGVGSTAGKRRQRPLAAVSFYARAARRRRLERRKLFRAHARRPRRQPCAIR